ncbi:serine hydrolase [Aquimarina sp. 2201CG5-10]|uniref:serine hydrolase n=1 Tax=Aquimarina callyspongiae TaxID=3098150 RepID=UPI002AB49251|nr:serine hydrolase [Aquimarina sp. 2201CG5-10]MDY8135092.1 serine hydrolase [Aquimarina sp. 2201CG5-10]
MKNTILPLFILAIISVKTAFSQTFPGKNWERNEYSIFSGWDQNKLEAIREYVVDSTATTGMLIIHDGEIIFEYGNINENSYIASCRKSVMAMLYGKYVKDGTIDLDKSLKNIQIPKTELLLNSEKEATVRDIISSRSGVFLPAANGGDLQHLAPKRGSVKPGEFWLYNNWDFNIAGYIFEKETKNNIYDDLESQFAIPLQMQDWDRSLQEKDENPLITDISAYHMWFSARDMARLGLLMLNNGTWNNTQIINKDWVHEMTTPKSTFEEVDKIAPFFKENGGWYSYGYMWWLWEKPSNKILKGAYTASGAWGQNITMFPEINTVLVIKTNDIYERQKGDHYYIIDEVSKSYNLEAAQLFKKALVSLKGNNISEFIKDLKAIKKSNPNIDFQDVINKIGYGYLSSKDYDKAIQLFMFNIEQHPKMWNLYDSLGEAYFFSGDYKKSLINYKKALELNTQNQYNFNDRIKHVIKKIELKI